VPLKDSRSEPAEALRSRRGAKRSVLERRLRSVPRSNSRASGCSHPGHPGEAYGPRSPRALPQESERRSSAKDSPPFRSARDDIARCRSTTRSAAPPRGTFSESSPDRTPQARAARPWIRGRRGAAPSASEGHGGCRSRGTTGRSHRRCAWSLAVGGRAQHRARPLRAAPLTSPWLTPHHSTARRPCCSPHDASPRPSSPS
jgi:hypothetical protein